MFTYERTSTEIAELGVIIGLPFVAVIAAVWLIARYGWAIRIMAVMSVALVMLLSAGVMLPSWKDSVEARNTESMKQWVKSEYNIDLSDDAARQIMGSGDGQAAAMIYGDASFVPHWEDNSLELRSLLTGEALKPLPAGAEAHSHNHHDHSHAGTDDHSDEEPAQS